MAPLTRSRAGAGNVPTQLNALYYAQRASAGLIIFGGDPDLPGGPGLCSNSPRHSQRRADRGVEMRDGRSPCLRRPHRAPALAIGHVAHPSFQPGGALPVAPLAPWASTRAGCSSWISYAVVASRIRLSSVSQFATLVIAEVGIRVPYNRIGEPMTIQRLVTPGRANTSCWIASKKRRRSLGRTRLINGDITASGKAWPMN